MVEETHHKIKVGLHQTPIVEAAEKVMEEAVATTPVVEVVAEAVVEVPVVAVEAEVAQEVVVKPKKKRKYKPRNPQNKK